MTLAEWCKTQPHGALVQIQRETGIGYTTLMRAKRGEPIAEYSTAKKISDATGGEVSIAVTFEIDTDGILRVRAREPATNKVTSARMQVLGTLPPEELARLLRAGAERTRPRTGSPSTPDGAPTLAES